jgi:hypothetical protein
MPIDFRGFQLLLAGVMIAGLLVFLAPLALMTARSRLPRVTVVLVLVPVVGLLWLCVLAHTFTSRAAGLDR